MFLEEMKWPEIDVLHRDDIIVVCCISAMEQHSLHLPMGTDYRIGTELLCRLERRIPRRLLCLPAIWLGSSAHHMSFAGTISASTRTMQQMIHDIAASIRRHGFRKMLLLNSHGGNRALLGCSIQDLGQEFPDLTIAGATYWDIAREDLKEMRATGFGGMGHACELETSVMLSVANHLVDMSKAQADGIVAESRFTREDMLSSPSIAMFKPMKTMSHFGGYGDPRTANPAKGELFLDAIVGGLEKLCMDLLERRT